MAHALVGHTGSVSTVAPGHGETVLTGSPDQTVRSWSPDGRELARYEFGSPVVEALAWSPDGSRLAAGARDNTIRIVDVRSDGPPVVLEGHPDWVGELAWSPSGRYLASSSDDRTARPWDLEHPDRAIVLTGHQNYVDGIACSPEYAGACAGGAHRYRRLSPADPRSPLRPLG